MKAATRLAGVLVGLWFAGAAADAARAGAPALEQVPYWQAMAGWWRAENTYLDGAMNYNIRAYHSLVHVELRGARMRETEYKFYPPGKLAQQAGRGQLGPDEGIEVATVSEGEAIDARGSVRLDGSDDSRIEVLGPDAAVRVTPNAATRIDTYRMYIFSPTPGKRYRSNFGIVSDRSGPGAANALPGAEPGDLRGYSLFRETRIATAEIERWRARFRELNRVAAVATTGSDGKWSIRRIGGQPR